MRHALLAAAAATVLLGTAAQAAPQTDCKPQAVLDLQRLSPEGHNVYKAATDKSFFLRWITCDDIQLGLATAVHETVHMLTEEKDAYVLIDGSTIKRDHSWSKFYPPREIARRFNSASTYVETYLKPGAASSAQDFVFLLDEMNAYTHDLNSVIKLQTVKKGEGQVDHRDGLTALMAFLTAYFDTAKQSKPATWQGLQKPETKNVIKALWGQAESVLASSCGVPGIGMDDRKYIGFMCDAKNNGALGDLLGRPAACATACLSPATSASSGSSTVQ